MSQLNLHFYLCFVKSSAIVTIRKCYFATDLGYLTIYSSFSFE